MKVFVAAKAGFCFGVKRAIEMVMESTRNRDGPLRSLGPLIHNPQVVKALAEEGIKEIPDMNEAKAGDRVIIRSHGVSPVEYHQAGRLDIQVVDATCPFVAKAQKKARQLHEEGYRVVIVGERDHPEVKGLVGWAGGKASVVKTIEEAGNLPEYPSIGVIAQTTQARENFRAIVQVLSSRCERIQVCDTICHATSQRQQAAVELAAKVNVMVVVGGYNSANTQKLAALCRAAGTPTYHVETADELQSQWFENAESAGLTAGASTPDWIIEEVYRRMMENDEKNLNEELQPEELQSEELQSEEPEAEEIVEVEEAAEEVEETAENEVTESEAGVETEAASEAGAEPETEGEPETASEEQAAEDTPEDSDEEDSDEASSPEQMHEHMSEVMDVKSLRPGEVVKGTIVQVTDDEVLVDVGAKSEGVIPIKELSCYDVNSPQDLVQVGDEIDVLVLKTEDSEGRVLLSKERADAEVAWSVLEEHLENGEPIEGTVKEVVKGGLLVDVNLRAFLPASLVEKGYVEDLTPYVGQAIKCKVIELNRPRRKVILSRKAIIEEELAIQRKELLERLQEGDVVGGIVRRLTNFGAFVDIGGIDGLLHISEMAWYRVDHPSDVVSVGDELEFKVLRVDQENEKISLGLKQVTPNPWDNVGDKYPVDSIVEAKVVRLAPFGAFVQLEPGVEGLVHISHLAEHYVSEPAEIVNEGDEIRVKVLNVDAGEKRIRLSVREVDSENKETEPSRERESRPKPKPKKAPKAQAQPPQQPVDDQDVVSDGATATIGEMVGDIFKNRE